MTNIKKKEFILTISLIIIVAHFVFDIIHLNVLAYISGGLFILMVVRNLVFLVKETNLLGKKKDLLSWKVDLLDAALSSLQDNVTILDTNLRIVYTNGAILNIEPSKLIGTRMFEGDDVLFLKAQEILNVIIQTKQEKRFIAKIAGKELLFFCSPLLDINNNCIGVTVLFANFLKSDGIIHIN